MAVGAAAGACGTIEESATRSVSAEAAAIAAAPRTEEPAERSPIVSLDGYVGELVLTETTVRLTFEANERYDAGIPEVVIAPDGTRKVRLKGRTIAEYEEFEEATAHRDRLAEILRHDPLAAYEGTVYDGVTNGQEVTMTMPRGTPRLAEGGRRTRNATALAVPAAEVEAARSPVRTTQEHRYPTCNELATLREELTGLEELIEGVERADDAQDAIGILGTLISVRADVTRTAIAARSAGILCRWADLDPRP